MACDSSMDSSVEGQCTCDGKIVKERSDTGKLAASLSCFECPKGQFAGLKWECDICENYAMEYMNIGGNWQCQCKTEEGFKKAGDDACVTQAEYDSLSSNVLGGDLKFSKRVTYSFLIDKEGNPTNNPITIQSEIYGQWFVKAAIGCNKDKDPQMCQALANLCVLQLYNESTVACEYIQDTIQTNAPDSNNQEFRESMPWIRYKEDPIQLLRTPLPENFKLKTSFSDDPKTYKVQYLTF